MFELLFRYSCKQANSIFPIGCVFRKIKGKSEREGVTMSRFQQGILLGLMGSVLLTLALALTLNEKRRRQVRSRFETLRNALPGTEQLKQSAQEATTRARKTGSHLGEQVQETAGKLVQHTQEILSTAQQKAASLGDQPETRGTV